jgi:hypothetical protein
MSQSISRAIQDDGPSVFTIQAEQNDIFRDWQYASRLNEDPDIMVEDVKGRITAEIPDEDVLARLSAFNERGDEYDASRIVSYGRQINIEGVDRGIQEAPIEQAVLDIEGGDRGIEEAPTEQAVPDIECVACMEMTPSDNI